MKAQYGTIENTPSSVLSELVNVNQLNSLVASVPSKFETILNDANLKMGVTRESIDSVYLGCNGIVYLTNKVFAPATYSSVLFPTVIDTENLNVLFNAIDNMDYKPYLNSMVSRYSFFAPTNKGMLCYVDPVSFGKQQMEMWRFGFDATKAKNQRIFVDVFACNLTDNGVVVGDSLRRITGGTGNAQILNRLTDILDNIIGVELVESGKSYYITKGKSFVKVGGTQNQPGAMTASGSLQTEINKPAIVEGVFHMENGYAYVCNDIVNSTRKTTAAVLSERSEFSDFYHMLIASGCVALQNADGQAAKAVEAAKIMAGGGSIANLEGATKDLKYVWVDFEPVDSQM